MTISEWQKEIRRCNAEHGFESEVRGDNPGMFSEKMLLMVSEVSEALEEFRNHHGISHVYYNGEKPEGIPIELADVAIRLFDFCEANGIDLEKMIEAKHAYNKTRPYKHGGKKI